MGAAMRPYFGGTNGVERVRDIGVGNRSQTDDFLCSFD
jgi:hypothetical protein